MSDSCLFDSVSVITEPRFKASVASGCEWRYSYRVDLCRKGVVLYSETFSSMEAACAAVPYLITNYDLVAVTSALENHPELGEMCQTPGCNKVATELYKKKADYCKGCCRQLMYQASVAATTTVQYCKEHACRGDSDYNDCDNNLVSLGSTLDPVQVQQQDTVAIEAGRPAAIDLTISYP